MRIGPQTRELREALTEIGVAFETDDDEFVTDDYGCFVAHIERTGLESRDGRWMSVIMGWTRDEDGEMRYDTHGGRFGYLELSVDGGEPRMATVGEVMEESGWVGEDAG